MAVDRDAEAFGQAVDRVLEAGIVERHEPPALLADEMVMMVAPGLAALKPGLAVADRDPLDEAVFGEQLEDPVDAGSPGRPSARPQLVLDLYGAQRTWLPREQLDHPLPGSPPFQPRFREHGVNVLAPVARRHLDQD